VLLICALFFSVAITARRRELSQHSVRIGFRMVSNRHKTSSHLWGNPKNWEPTFSHGT
jgi:hypothetical protein